MNERIRKTDNRTIIRWKLLTGASVLALASYVASTCIVEADDASRPIIWLELDGQFAQQESGIEPFAPAFLGASPFDGMSHLDLEKGSSMIWDKDAKLRFQSDGSDWVLSLAARYGKIGRSETRDGHPALPSNKYGARYSAYQHFATQSDESHAILDFQVGKDVGLGMLGNSVLSAGVRIAQFSSRSHVAIKSQPTNLPTGTCCNTVDKFYASFEAKRRFSGMGPSLSWDATANIAGNSASGAISLDWGVNGAVLFGRQRTRSSHQTSKAQFRFYARTFAYQRPSTPSVRSRDVTVPNLGGFAAVSWRTSNAKISIGYKVDLFFSAIDGGIDARKEENRGFYGPYASISIGLGD